MNFTDLRAMQSGNDLLLTIRGTDQGMTLKDYYTTPQEWMLQDSTGAQQGVADVLNATNQDEYSALRRGRFLLRRPSRPSLTVICRRVTNGRRMVRWHDRR